MRRQQRSITLNYLLIIDTLCESFSYFLHRRNSNVLTFYLVDIVNFCTYTVFFDCEHLLLRDRSSDYLIRDYLKFPTYGL